MCRLTLTIFPFALKSINTSSKNVNNCHICCAHMLFVSQTETPRKLSEFQFDCICTFSGKCKSYIYTGSTKNLWGTYYSLYKCVGPVNNMQCMHALHFLFPCASRNGTSTCSLCRSSFMVLRPMWSRPPPGSNPQRSNYKPGPPTTALPGHCTSSQWDLSMYEVSSSFFSTFRVMPRTRIKRGKSTKGNSSKIMQIRVMGLEHCTSPQWDLFIYEVSSSYLQYFKSYAPDKN